MQNNKHHNIKLSNSSSGLWFPESTGTVNRMACRRKVSSIRSKNKTKSVKYNRLPVVVIAEKTQHFPNLTGFPPDFK